MANVMGEARIHRLATLSATCRALKLINQN